MVFGTLETLLNAELLKPAGFALYELYEDVVVEDELVDEEDDDLDDDMEEGDENDETVSLSDLALPSASLLAKTVVLSPFCELSKEKKMHSSYLLKMKAFRVLSLTIYACEIDGYVNVVLDIVVVARVNFKVGQRRAELLACWRLEQRLGLVLNEQI